MANVLPITDSARHSDSADCSWSRGRELGLARFCEDGTLMDNDWAISIDGDGISHESACVCTNYSEVGTAKEIYR